MDKNINSLLCKLDDEIDKKCLKSNKGIGTGCCNHILSVPASCSSYYR
jgi:hypothetical protein